MNTPRPPSSVPPSPPGSEERGANLGSAQVSFFCMMGIFTLCDVTIDVLFALTNYSLWSLISSG